MDEFDGARRRVIRGTFEEKVQQILDGAPGMERATAEVVVRGHDALGVDEIIEVSFDLASAEQDEDALALAELFRQAAEAVGDRVLRDDVPGGRDV